MTSATNVIPIGNYEAKYASQNPISRYLVNGFLRQLDAFVAKCDPISIHEAGCGEGELIHRLAKTRANSIKGTDISDDVFAAARTELDPGRFSFERKSIYDLSHDQDHAELVLCCEVLEHIDDPLRALASLHQLKAKNYIFSVPREPLWRIMNMARLKYLNDFGNTPGHLNHWSQRGFRRLLENRFEIIELKAPLPWTMVLCRAK